MALTSGYAPASLPPAERGQLLTQPYLHRSTSSARRNTRRLAIYADWESVIHERDPDARPVGSQAGGDLPPAGGARGPPRTRGRGAQARVRVRPTALARAGPDPPLPVRRGGARRPQRPGGLERTAAAARAGLADLGRS